MGDDHNVNSLRKFCQALPKAELHAHLNGSLSEETISKLITLKRKKNPSWKINESLAMCMDKRGERTMKEGFALFGLIHEVCDNEEAAYTAARDVIKEFSDDGVRYLELRTTPRAVAATSMTKLSYVRSVLKGIADEMSSNANIVVRLILSIDRRVTMEDAWDTLKLAEMLATETASPVVGLDLSGDPTKGEGPSFLPIFAAARNKQLKCVLHVAELESQLPETEELLLFLPDRIGHGTYLHPDVGGRDRFVEIIETNKIPIEFCFTSNLKTGTVPDYASHHFLTWFTMGHPCLICTDDKGVFSTTLSNEYVIASETFNLRPPDLWRLSYESLNYVSGDQHLKQELRATWNSLKAGCDALL